MPMVDPHEPTELLDIVTPTGTHVGTGDRDSVHSNGDWHQVFHCLVIRSGLPATIVLQRRHRSKAAFPGLLDLSATGHLTAGEEPIDGVRELNEELGLSADGQDLVPVGVRLLADDDGEGRNRERVHLYFLSDDRALERFAPDPDEVESLVEIGAADVLSLIDQAGATSVPATEWTPGQAPFATTVSAADLVAPIDGYWTVTLIMAERFATGQGPLAI